MGTTVDVRAVGVTGDVTTLPLLPPPPAARAIGTTGDDKLRLNGRAIDVPAIPLDRAGWTLG
jgi:hypothetical protein